MWWRCLAGKVQAASFFAPPLDLDKGEPLTSERYEVDLADRGFVALRRDAVASQAKQEHRERLREEAAAIGLDTYAAHVSRPWA